MGEQRMLTRQTTRAKLRLHFALFAGAMSLIVGSPAAPAQGLVKGVQQGAQAGNKAAGPVGGVLGGAIGGVVGVFTGVLGVPGNTQAPAASGTNETKQSGSAKTSKTGKGGKATKQAVLTQPQGQPQLTAEQSRAKRGANIE